LNVAAKDLGTNKEASVRIEQSSGLSESEIERMRKEADSHSAEDKRRLELATLRNQADQMCYQLEKLIKEHKDKLKDADREPLEKAIQKTREKAKGDDPQAIKSALEELEQVSHAFSKSIYEKAGTAPEAAASNGSEPKKESGDDAIDAEFEVKS
jgi:molecular chaperone DnaK